VRPKGATPHRDEVDRGPCVEGNLPRASARVPGGPAQCGRSN
jgi:hypothetical protein